MNKLVEVSVAEDHKELTLMEDGAPIHTAMFSQQWCNEHQIHKLNCPPSSPDLNTSKNLLFKMKNIVTRLFNPKAMDKLAAAIDALWEDLPFYHLEALLQSFPRRMPVVVDYNGAPSCWYEACEP
ncbi:hypothetical protein O181_101137 [Austropuccinia psidii MF-1]|uniref:Tc1-like transposase DDE domain-containing protein n=1 Tax=Austropuccinia psidii MF-1 TaxID=1389203 RepID=A0A9Q3JGM1_9BASI|nr:hypothetical protein [Austropuccinia psidii MF-1]